jgi:hypothetical protein
VALCAARACPYSFYWYYFARATSRSREIADDVDGPSERPPTRRYRFYVLIALAYGVAAVSLFAATRSGNELLVVPLIILEFASWFGMIWMMYQAVRFEPKPLPYVLLALLPFAFIWYYVERIGAGSFERVPIAAFTKTLDS